MGFGEAVSSGFKNLTNFSGRASRSEFWWYALVSFIIYIVLVVILQNVLGSQGTAIIISQLIFALLLIAAGARRLHDTGKSGWLELLWLIPCVGPIILIIFWAQAGQPGDNQHGSAPA